MKQLALKLPGDYEIGNPPNFKSDQFTDLGSFLSGLLTVAFYISGALLISWFAWGVFEYIFAGGEKEKLGKAQKRITWAIIGFLLIAAAFLVSQYVQQFFPAQPVPVQPITPP